MIQTAKDLELAAARIEAFGWHQGSCKSKDGAECVWYAIYMATGKRPEERAEQAFLRAIGKLDGRAATNISQWNDAPGRTKRQVMAAFRRAIRAERGAVDRRARLRKKRTRQTQTT